MKNLFVSLIPKNIRNRELIMVYLRLRKSGFKDISLSTGIKTKKEYIQDGNLSKKIGAEHLDKIITLQREIEGIINEIQKEGLEPNPRLVKSRYDLRRQSKNAVTPQMKTFWEGYEEFVELKSQKSKEYYKKVRSIRNVVQRFEEYLVEQGKGKITFNYLIERSDEFEFYFQKYCHNPYKHKSGYHKEEYSNGYYNKLINEVSQVLSLCFKRGYIKVKPTFKKQQEFDKQEKVFLRKQEIEKLFNATDFDYEEGKDFSSIPNIEVRKEELNGVNASKYGGVRYYTNWELVKDIFLFQCATGCRYSDILIFKVGFNRYQEYQGQYVSFFQWYQKKTGGKVNVPSNRINEYIFRKYARGKSKTDLLFPAISNQKFNRALKFIFKHLKMNRKISLPYKVGNEIKGEERQPLYDVITSHAGRRTFIKSVVNMGIDYKTAMSLSGHKTYQEFLGYVSVTSEDQMKGAKLFDVEPKEQQLDSIDGEILSLLKQIPEDKKSVVLTVVRSFVNY